MTYPDGSFVTYQYNANGWLTNILDGGTTSIVTYDYDAAGRRTKRTLENGTHTEYGYDQASQMTNIAHKLTSGGSVFSSFAYGYDDAGQRRWVKRANGKGEVYQYDAINQLTNVLYEATNPHTTPSAWTNEARYAFDAAGNRTSLNITNTGTTTYAANELNQYTNVGGALPSYNDNGSLTFDGSTWSYFYDRDNRLIEAEKDGGDTAIFYRYDAFNRLIARIKGATTTRFYYDDRWRVVAEYDGSDNLVAKYVYGPEIDEPIRLTKSGENYYYHAAALGTVTEITGSAGNLVEQYRYDVYGEPAIYDSGGSPLSDSGIGNRLMFDGRDRDPDTKLYNIRHRWYAPALGRWVSRDPLGEEAFFANFVTGRPLGEQLRIRGESSKAAYVYLANDPIASIDPLGLLRFDPKCNSTDVDTMKIELKDRCQKAKAGNCYRCLKQKYQDAMQKLCDEIDKDTGPMVICDDASTSDDCKNQTMCGWERFGRIHICVDLMQDPTINCKLSGCTLLHEAAHAVGGVGDDSAPKYKHPEAYAITKCAGCPDPPKGVVLPPGY